ncbi:natterin-3-like [Lissotriton helveticus]
MEIRDLLHRKLENLEERDFAHFKIRLSDDPHKLPRGKTENLDHFKLADKMVQHYTPNKALEVAIDVLKKLNQTQLAEELRNESQTVTSAMLPPGIGSTRETKGPEKVDILFDLTHLAAQLHDVFTTSPDVGSGEHSSNQLAIPAGATDTDGQILFNDCKNLKWVDWNGSIPDWAVSIENESYSRRDYVSAGVSIGYYTPSKGPYCFYPLSDKEHHTPNFQILVNEGDFERLEWKAGSWGSVPDNAVRCHPAVNTFVGRNKYGLGKVVPKFNAFFLPCEGKEYCYKWYEVLTVCRDYNTESISNVQYQMKKGTAEYQPFTILDESIMENRSGQEVKRTATFQKEITYRHHWDTDRGVKAGVSLHFRTQFPIETASEKKEFVLHETFQGLERLSMKTTQAKMIEEKIEVTVPPNHACELVLQARKITAKIPYQATLCRTYNDGQIRSTTIQGVYTGTGYDGVEILVKACHLISD